MYGVPTCIPMSERRRIEPKNLSTKVQRLSRSATPNTAILPEKHFLNQNFLILPVIQVLLERVHFKAISFSSGLLMSKP